MKVSDKENQRLGRAIIAGWEFSNFKFNPDICQRHSAWVKMPNADGYACIKVDAEVKEGWVNAILDEAGVQK